MGIQIETITKFWEEEKGYISSWIFFFIVCVLNIFTTQILIHVNEKE